MHFMRSRMKLFLFSENSEDTYERLLAKAIAPCGEELFFAIEDKFINGPTKNDLVEQESTETEYFYISRLIQKLAERGATEGIVLFNPHYYDQFSKEAIYLLMTKSLKTNFNITFVSKNNNFIKLLSKEFQLNLIRGTSRVSLNSSFGKYAASYKILALCPNGIPVSTAENLGVAPEIIKCFKQAYLADEWVFLPSRYRKLFLPLDISERELILENILFHFPTTGFSYIFKQGIVLQSSKWELVKKFHRVYLIAIKNTSKDLIERYYTQLLKYEKQFNREEYYNIMLNLGRILPFGLRRQSFKRARVYYRKAYKLCNNLEDKIALIYEIANSHAVKKDPVNLKIAERWYSKGMALLKKIINHEDRVRLSIRLKNGLALVEYHYRNNKRALELEEESRELALSVKDFAPSITNWALQLLNTNQAKLVQQRFNNTDLALSFLNENLQMGEEKFQYNSALNVARILFDKKDYKGVLNTLNRYFDPDRTQTSVIVNDFDELSGRMLLILSKILLDDTADVEYHFKKINYLGNLIDPTFNFDLVDYNCIKEDKSIPLNEVCLVSGAV